MRVSAIDTGRQGRARFSFVPFTEELEYPLLLTITEPQKGRKREIEPRERAMAQSITARRISERPKARQLSLFPEIICTAYLVATESPKSAFYRIWIESDAGTFTVRKESGFRDRVLDKRAWPFDSLDDARKLFDRRVKSTLTRGVPAGKMPSSIGKTNTYRVMSSRRKSEAFSPIERVVRRASSEYR